MAQLVSETGDRKWIKHVIENAMYTDKITDIVTTATPPNGNVDGKLEISFQIADYNAEIGRSRVFTISDAMIPKAEKFTPMFSTVAANKKAVRRFSIGDGLGFIPSGLAHHTCSPSTTAGRAPVTGSRPAGALLLGTGKERGREDSMRRPEEGRGSGELGGDSVIDTPPTPTGLALEKPPLYFEPIDRRAVTSFIDVAPHGLRF
eukprot:jgi/Mesvir1/5618/Mv15636-RA.1